MKRIASILLLTLCIASIYAQHIALQWQPVATFTADSVATQALVLDNGIYERHNLLPSLKVPLPHNSNATIENAVWTDLSPDEQKVAELYADAIPDTLTYSNTQSTVRKQKTHFLIVFPFARIQGKIKKLQTFDIKTADTQYVAAAKQSRNYADNSVLANGTFVKIAVAKSGIYKLTYEEIATMGINPQGVRVYGYGGAMLAESFAEPYIDDLPEVAIYEYKGSDNVFGPGDYILFYAQGPTSWKYISSNRTFQHTQNPYSNYGYYFVTSGTNDSKRIAAKDAPEGEIITTITSFTDYLVHEQDLKNLISSGREFYGEEFNSTHLSYSFNFDLPNVLEDDASFRINAAARSQIKPKITATINNEQCGALSIESTLGAPTYEYAKTQSASFYFRSPATNQLRVKLDFDDPVGLAWLNFFEINIRRSLQLTSNTPLFFRNVDYDGEEGIGRFVVGNATNKTEIWDITDPQNIVRVSSLLDGNTLIFTDSIGTLRQYVALNPDNGTFLSPTIVGTIANQNLHALPQAEMVIIAPADFMAEAERLANAHRAVQGFTVHIVDVEQVYNEFSSGTPDATAYRRLMKLFYDRATSDDDLPRYLLLFGDGCYDNRNIEITDKTHNKLLTFQSYNSVHGTNSYVCDDYFALLDDNEGVNFASDGMDIGVGRLPVYNATLATIAVDKAIDYLENGQTGAWKNQLLFVADDGDNNEHIKSCDSVANMTRSNYPDMLVRKLYLDAYKQVVAASGESYPLAIDLFDNYIKNGVLMINYMGHGGHTQWANENILNYDRIVGMYNTKLPLFVTATCDFSRFDDISDSGGELLLLNEHGGAIALFTTTRTVYAEPNFKLNLQFSKFIFSRNEQQEPICFGDVMRCAKNKLIGDANKMNFTLLGDPAIPLSYPATHTVATDSIMLITTDEQTSDTIRALSRVRIAGHVSAENSSETDADFNGYVTLNIFDKQETIKTLCNDATDKANNVPYYFTDRTNTLFNGSTYVKNGKFNAEFIVPKDIRYNYGEGRIVYYANDTITNAEGNGYDEQFIVGGEDANATIENAGPEVQLYLNTPLFQSGDKTNESPLLVASIYDESGINAIGSGIGHDIIIKLDNDPRTETVLNSYYETAIGEYRRGHINYQFSNLDEGKHHLFFRVWDMQNNSTTCEFDFEVVNGLEPSLSEMYVYPNPATHTANFVYVHDRPEQPLNVSATVSDLSGRVVYAGTQTIYTYSNRTEIAWDFAGQLNPGLYVVRMQVQINDSASTAKTLKLMVK